MNCAARRRLAAVRALAPLVVVGMTAAPPAAAADAPAGFDTLSVQAVLERRRAVLDSLLLPQSTALDTVGLGSAADSLDRGGAADSLDHGSATDSLDHGGTAAVLARPAKVRAGHSTLALRFEPLALTTYNRIDGLRIGAGGTAGFGRWVRADAAGAYGTASEDWSGRAGLEYGKNAGPVVRIDWADLVEPFGPTPDGRSLGLLALAIGQDRRDYLRRRSLTLEIAPWKQESRQLALTLFARRESSVQANTDFSLVGGGLPMHEPNPEIDAGEAHGGALAGRLGSPGGREEIAADIGVTGGAAGGDFEYSWQHLRLAGRRSVLAGGRLSLVLEGMNVGGSPPKQAAAYLGGDANLRGYERLEFAGRQQASARLEYALGVDLLRLTRIPLVDRLHLQFIPFADAGSTWGETRSVDRTSGSLDGTIRTSVGLGVQRTLWLPGIEALRLDVMRRTDRGGDAWSWWLRVVELPM